jgi:hypothetical protein
MNYKDDQGNQGRNEADSILDAELKRRMRNFGEGGNIH